MRTATAFIMGAGTALSSFAGFAAAQDGLPDEIVINAVIRDFRPHNAEGGHPDFQRRSGSQARYGLLEEKLGPDGKPVFASSYGYKAQGKFQDAARRNIAPNLADESRGDRLGTLVPVDKKMIESQESFDQWYRDVPGVNATTVKPLTLVRTPGTATYVFDSARHAPWDTIGGFFPINDELYGNFIGGRNFHFTTEIVTTFVYNEADDPIFLFTGDDDVWVFIDGKLVLDLGGVHGRVSQQLDISRLGLEDGEKYDLRIFHAERRTSQSNFRMETTLRLFRGDLPTTTALHD